jgi:Glycosyltransferase family 87
VELSFRARGHRSTRRIGIDRFGDQLALVLGAGAVVRVALAVFLIHRSYDVDSVRIVNSVLRSHFSAVYETGRWPYPGGLLPWVLASGSLAHATGADISVWFKLPSIVADLSVAWFVQAFLGLRGMSDGKRLTAAALVCLGPSFIAISGYEGQIDGLAILPGVAALYLWERGRAPFRAHDRRRLLVAALIGVGAAIKTVPILLILAFLPSIKGLAARARFCLIAVGIPVVSTLPWVLTNPRSLSIIVNYTGIGVGPLALAAQPSIAKDILTTSGNVHFNSLTAILEDHGKLILYAGLAVVTILLLWRRPRADLAAVLVWLTVYAFMPFFFFQYVVWGLPFFLMAGYIRSVLIVQLVLLIPTVLWEGKLWNSSAVVWPYFALMTLAWAGALAALAVHGRRVYRTV